MKKNLESIRLAGLLFCLTPVAAAVAQTAGPVEPATVVAQDVAAHDDTYRVVVTGSRAPTPLKDAPQRIELVTRKDVRDTPNKELVDILKKNSSVDVIQYSGMLSSVGIRGFEPKVPMTGSSSRVLVVENGLPVSAGNMSVLPTQGLARVEVLKGPASALYGSQAMGGVINLVPVRRTGPIQGGMGVSVGNFGYHGVQADIGGAVSSRVNLDYFGDWQKQGDYKTGTGEERAFSGYKVQSHAIRAGVELAPEWTLDLRSRVYRGKDIRTPATTYDPPLGKDIDLDSHSLTLNGKVDSHALTASLYVGRQNQTDMAHPPGFSKYVSGKGNDRWHGLQLKDVWQWSPHATLVAGFDYETRKAGYLSYYDFFNPTVQGVATAYSANSKRSNKALYAQQSFDFNGGATNLYVGGRYDWVKLSTLETSHIVSNTPTSQSFGKFNPSAGFKHYATPNFNIHGSIGQGFVIPDATQLTGRYTSVYGTYIGNPNLVPETSVTGDLGLGWENENWNADLTYFTTRVRNKIVDEAKKGVHRYVNSDRARMQGLELDASWKIHPSLALGLGATHYLKAEQFSKNVWSDINGVPKTSVRLILDGQWDKVGARVGMRYAGKRKNNDPLTYTQKQYPGFAVWDLSARYQFARGHSISLGVDNLFDKAYAEVPGYPQPGRQIKLGYRWDFK